MARQVTPPTKPFMGVSEVAIVLCISKPKFTFYHR